MITNRESGTNIFEIAPDTYRINTPVCIPGGPDRFNFNQYLVIDEEPLLFHTGPRKMFAVVREAIERVMPIGQLRYIGLSHFEADECGAMNEFLAVAPRAVPLCGHIAAILGSDQAMSLQSHGFSSNEVVLLSLSAQLSLPKSGA